MTAMTNSDAVEIVHSVISEIAPDTVGELGRVDAAVDVFEELGLDSMDHMTIMEALVDRTGVDIPASSYPQLRTLDSLCAHLLRT